MPQDGVQGQDGGPYGGQQFLLVLHDPGVVQEAPASHRQ